MLSLLHVPVCDDDFLSSSKEEEGAGYVRAAYSHLIYPIGTIHHLRKRRAVSRAVFDLSYPGYHTLVKRGCARSAVR